MLETLGGKLVAAGLIRGGQAARKKARGILLRDQYSEEVERLAAVFNDELETALSEEAEKRDSDVLEAVALNWPAVAEELAEIDFTFQSESEAVADIAQAIADVEEHDLEASPGLGRGLRDAVRTAYAAAMTDFRQRISGTDLAHEFQMEVGLDLTRQVRELTRRLEGREYYDVFPGDPEGLEAAANTVETRELDYVARPELEDEPSAHRILVTGEQGVGKSRALAEMVLAVEGEDIEHVVKPRRALTEPGQLNPFEREQFVGDVLLIWDDVHEESNHVVTDAVRRLADILDDGSHDLWVFVAGRTEKGEIPEGYGDPEGFWNEHGFEEVELELLGIEPLVGIFEEASRWWVSLRRRSTITR